jgi:hypothetical protein
LQERGDTLGQINVTAAGSPRSNRVGRIPPGVADRALVDLVGLLVRNGVRIIARIIGALLNAARCPPGILQFGDVLDSRGGPVVLRSVIGRNGEMRSALIAELERNANAATIRDDIEVFITDFIVFVVS